MNAVSHKIARRVLLGVAYGDAMGMPTETLTRDQIIKRFGRVTDFLPSPHGDDIPFVRDFRPGQVTDDTDNTMMLCRMLGHTSGKIDPDLFVDYLIRWLDEDPSSAFAVGPSTKRAIEAIQHGVPIDQAGRMGTTNGAAMKISPIGIVDDYRDMPGLVDDVAAVCTPTHNTTVAIQGAAAVAACVSYGARVGDANGIMDWDLWYDLIADAVHEAARCGHPYPSPDLLRRIDYGRQIANESISDDVFEDTLYSFLGTGLETAETVPAAVTIVYRHQGDLRRSVECAANIGGDTDTIGAICGAMCAGIGFNLSDAVIHTLETVNHMNFDAAASLLLEVDGSKETDNSPSKERRVQ